MNNYIICLKHGNKYSSDYVNNLYNMVVRHCTLDFEFICLTDDITDINPEIRILPLPLGLEGWWCKPYIFSKDLPLNGNILYIDLDVVIGNNIDKLFTYMPDDWCIIRDFERFRRPDWYRYNSSVIRFKTNQLNYLWDDFKEKRTLIQSRLHGDQDWIYEKTRNDEAALFPEDWIMSWKWEVRNNKESIPKDECSICVFHGVPNPHECEDTWVKYNWK